MEPLEDDNFWEDCVLLERDPDVMHGALVVAGTRITPDTLTGHVEGFEESQGMTEEQAIARTLREFPSTPGGAKTIRELLAYEQAHTNHLQPS